MSIIFESFWHFLGTVVLIALVGDILVEAVKAARK